MEIPGGYDEERGRALDAISRAELDLRQARHHLALAPVHPERRNWRLLIASARAALDDWLKTVPANIPPHPASTQTPCVLCGKPYGLHRAGDLRCPLFSMAGSVIGHSKLHSYR